MAVNAHGKLASNIFDYLLNEDQLCAAMLVDTLYKLELNFCSHNEFVNTLGPKVLKVIKHFKNINYKNSVKYLEKFIINLIHSYGKIRLL